ncbi:hypothetical protein RRF57_012021 [Xylaria bambusicola]|uniref:Uncharacterized protein n=1 Tax=Xylaria bambusicola TaxID=326684 RepID=A0AAN7UXH0_9PEZI
MDLWANRQTLGVAAQPTQALDEAAICPCHCARVEKLARPPSRARVLAPCTAVVVGDVHGHLAALDVVGVTRSGNELAQDLVGAIGLANTKTAAWLYTDPFSADPGYFCVTRPNVFAHAAVRRVEHERAVRRRQVLVDGGQHLPDLALRRGAAQDRPRLRVQPYPAFLIVRYAEHDVVIRDAPREPRPVPHVPIGSVVDGLRARAVLVREIDLPLMLAYLCPQAACETSRQIALRDVTQTTLVARREKPVHGVSHALEYSVLSPADVGHFLLEKRVVARLGEIYLERHGEPHAVVRVRDLVDVFSSAPSASKMPSGMAPVASCCDSAVRNARRVMLGLIYAIPMLSCR